MSRRKTHETIDEVHQRVLASRPDIKVHWEKNAERRKLSEFLLRARYQAGLSQSQVAKAAGWDKSFVSRLESASSRSPDLETISRYMTACGATVGLAVMKSTGLGHSRIIDAVPLNAMKSLSEAKPEVGVMASRSRRRQSVAPVPGD